MILEEILNIVLTRRDDNYNEEPEAQNLREEEGKTQDIWFHCVHVVNSDVYASTVKPHAMWPVLVIFFFTKQRTTAINS